MSTSEVSASPRVSVVVPTYNGVRYLRQTIDRVLAQSFEDRELIVVDDASTDATPELVRGYGDAVRLLRLPANAGVAHARNAGMQAAGAEFIALLDHDDWWPPDMLARLVPILEAHTEAALVYGQCVAVDHDGKPTGKRPWPRRPYTGNHWRDVLWADRFHLGAAILRKSCAAAVGWMDETLRGTDDWEFKLRLATRFPFVGVAMPLLYFRQHPASLGQRQLHMLQAELQAVERFILYEKNANLNEPRWHGLSLCALVRAHCRLAEYHFKAGDTSREEQHRLAALASQPAVGTVPDAAFAGRLYGDLGFLHERRGARAQARRYYLMAARYRPFHRRTVNRVLGGYLPQALLRRRRSRGN